MVGVGSGTYFDLRALLSCDSSLRLRFMIPLYASNFRFSPLLRTIQTIFDLPLPPPYSIPSLVVSVVAIAVTEVLAYTSLPIRFYTFRSSTFFKTSNSCITAVIAEVLAQISRTILGTLDRCFK